MRSISCSTCATVTFVPVDLTLISAFVYESARHAMTSKVLGDLFFVIACNILVVWAVVIPYQVLIQWWGLSFLSVFNLQVLSRHRELHFDGALSGWTVRLAKNRSWRHRCWDEENENDCKSVLKTSWLPSGGGLQYSLSIPYLQWFHVGHGPK